MEEPSVDTAELMQRLEKMQKTLGILQAGYVILILAFILPLGFVAKEVLAVRNGTSPSLPSDGSSFTFEDTITLAGEDNSRLELSAKRIKFLDEGGRTTLSFSSEGEVSGKLGQLTVKELKVENDEEYDQNVSISPQQIQIQNKYDKQSVSMSINDSNANLSVVDSAGNHAFDVVVPKDESESSGRVMSFFSPGTGKDFRGFGVLLGKDASSLVLNGLNGEENFYVQLDNDQSILSLDPPTGKGTVSMYTGNEGSSIYLNDSTGDYRLDLLAKIIQGSPGAYISAGSSQKNRITLLAGKEESSIWLSDKEGKSRIEFALGPDGQANGTFSDKDGEPRISMVANEEGNKSRIDVGKKGSTLASLGAQNGDAALVLFGEEATNNITFLASKSGDALGKLSNKDVAPTVTLGVLKEDKNASVVAGSPRESMAQLKSEKEGASLALFDSDGKNRIHFYTDNEDLARGEFYGNGGEKLIAIVAGKVGENNISGVSVGQIRKSSVRIGAGVGASHIEMFDKNGKDRINFYSNSDGVNGSKFKDHKGDTRIYLGMMSSGDYATRFYGPGESRDKNAEEGEAEEK